MIEEVIEIKDRVAKIELKTNIIYKKLMGNGNSGLIDQWNQFQGGLSVFKFMAGSGCLLAIISIAIAIFGGG